MPDVIEICGYKAYFGDIRITNHCVEANIIFCDVVSIDVALQLSHVLHDAFNVRRTEITKVYGPLRDFVGCSIKAYNVDMKEVQAWLNSRAK